MAPGEQHAQDWFLQQRAHCQGTASTGVILSLGPAQAWLRRPRSRGEQSTGGNTKGPQFSLPWPRYEGLSYWPATALCTTAEWAVPQGTLGPRCSLGGEYHHGVPSA